MSSNFARSTSVSWSYANEAAIMCPGALHARERVLSGSRKMEQARRIFLMVVRGDEEPAPLFSDSSGAA